MDKEVKAKTKTAVKSKRRRKSNVSTSFTFWRIAAITLGAVFIFSQFFSIDVKPKFDLRGGSSKTQKSQTQQSGSPAGTVDLNSLNQEVVPVEGMELPVSWGKIGPRLIEIGVIDLGKFEKIMPLTDAQREILTKGSDAKIKVDSEESRFVVNVLWALGLAQKSKVYDEGPMGTQYKDQQGNFASTGGWTVGKAEATSYLNAHNIIQLTDEQQDKVSEIAKNVYRPCCGNNTWFPDCNHGMAALGAIEMMVAEGMTDEEIYKSLLVLNSYWFPQTYVELAAYFKEQGLEWSRVDPKLVLGVDFSSAQGYQATRGKIRSLPTPAQGGGSCGV